jgi:hypothetical protein
MAGDATSRARRRAPSGIPAHVPRVAGTAGRRDRAGERGGRAAILLLAVTVLIYGAATIMSLRQTSATFDEVLLAAAGARGYATGDFDLVHIYHPRLMPYLYGLPVLLSGAQHPPHDASWNEPGRSFDYARQLFFQQGNDGPTLIFRTRLIAVAMGVCLLLLVFAFARRCCGDVAAIVAVGMTAFLPDLIAHGGIAYNDVPAAVTLFAAVWALDRAAAAPAGRNVVAAAALTAVALSVKYSAIALAPIALCLVLLEAAARLPDRKPYLRTVLRRVPLAVVSTYACLVAIYLGDFMLTSFLEGAVSNILHARGGHYSAPAWLLGRTSADGFWYYFPVAFLIKTPAALHILVLVALAGFWTTRRQAGSLLQSPLRGAVVAAAIFGCLLLIARLNIGFRHALPVLPFAFVVAAAGIARVWRMHGTAARAAIAGLLVVQAASVLSWYPHFIPYTSEYFAGRDRGHTRITDSSHDWGQGLPLLRRFMEDENVSAVYFSYFGSAVPEAYGIRYVPLRSFFELPATAAAAEAPRFVAISATNLVGVYVDDRFARFRDVEPYRVLGHSMFIYRLDD